MQPKTSVRQPVIAGARRQHLSELLRRWRRQPRKRSPVLFWTLLSLVLLSDGALLFLAAWLLGAWDSSSLLSEGLTCENRTREHVFARQALCLSLLATGFLAAAALMRHQRPLWRRRLMFVGLLSCLGCLGWSAGAILGQAIGDGATPIRDGIQGILWSTSVVVGLGFLVAVFLRDAFVALAGALASCIGFLAAASWPLAFAEHWPPLPQAGVGDIGLCVQVLILLSAYAALALAWSIAALTLLRILLAAPSSERLRQLATLCLWPIRFSVVLLAASAFLDGWRAMEQGFAWHGWNAQAMGTLVVLPGSAALVYARQRGRLSPFRLLAAVVLCIAFLALIWHGAVSWETGDLLAGAALASHGSPCLAGLISLSLAAHAALRYYFGMAKDTVIC